MSELLLHQLSDDVFLAVNDIVRFDNQSIEFIKQKAANSLRGRSRICAHKDVTDSLHEMIIAIRANSYIRPHRHHNKVESFHLVEGCVDVVIFSDDGEVVDVITLGEEHNFYYRLDKPHYHTLIIRTPILVIHEITNGPFDINASDFAIFSPEEGSIESEDYMRALKQQVDTYKSIAPP
jgi:cupin fold WbuC family metalloprotein